MSPLAGECGSKLQGAAVIIQMFQELFLGWPLLPQEVPVWLFPNAEDFGKSALLFY